MTDLEKRFELAMYEIYRRAKEECAYDAKRFVIMLKTKGGLETAMELLHNDKSYEGLIHLVMCSCKHLTDIIARGDLLEVEFNSDRRRMSDSEIYEDVVSMANSKGGVLLIGVEDDGAITGSQPRHGDVTDPPKLQSAIFNNTVPSINSRISVIRHDLGKVIAIEVDPYPEPCATKSGKALHRRNMSKPMAV